MTAGKLWLVHLGFVFYFTPDKYQFCAQSVDILQYFVYKKRRKMSRIFVIFNSKDSKKIDGKIDSFKKNYRNFVHFNLSILI